MISSDSWADNSIGDRIMIPAVWSSVIMEQILGAIKNEKVSSSVLVLLVAVAWWAHSWAEEEFVKKGEFSELQNSVSGGFESIEINDAGQIIRDIKLEILITKATSDDTTRLSDLDEELEHAKAYKQCLVKQEPNCQHLKEVE
jgi:hypothetical protein